MNRRDTVLALLALGAAPGLGYAQTAPARLAFISSGKSAKSSSESLAHLNPFLRGVGLTEGKDYIFESFWVGEDLRRFPALLEATERKPSIILVYTVAEARAAQQATKTIPILLVRINDPVGNGLVASLAHPGGNTTGLAGMTDHVPKIVEFIRLVFPNAKRLSVLNNPLNLSTGRIFDSLRTAAASVGMTAEAFNVDAPQHIGEVFSALARTKPDAIFAMPDSMLAEHSAQITALSNARKIPVFAAYGLQADGGALIGYGVTPNARDFRLEDYIKKLLAGAKPADLPVIQPSTFELVVNLRTAKALGIKIPTELLLRADRVIE